MNYDAKQWRAKLIKLGACSEEQAWADGKTAAECWEECPRGDWLLWLHEIGGLWAWPQGAQDAYLAQRKRLYDADRAKKFQPLEDAYFAGRQLLYDAYRAQLKLLDAAYEAQIAALIRSLVPNPFAEKGKK
jgi:hypothetical protein